MNTLNLDKLSPEERNLLDSLLAEVGEDIDFDWHLRALPHQMEAFKAVVEDKQPLSLFQWGRGSGKTETGSQIVRHLCYQYHNLRILIAAPTHADLRDTIVNGASGLMGVFPDKHKPKYTPSKRKLEFVNGNHALLLPASEPELFRGGNYHFAWLDEFAMWQKSDAFSNIRLCLRLGFPDGTDPQILITTTPKPSTQMMRLVESPGVYIHRAKTMDNIHLPKAVVDAWLEEYGNTTLGRQEIYGELLVDVEGALWSHSMLEAAREKTYDDPEIVCLGLDPAGTSNVHSDETGIVVVSRNSQGDYKVHCDESGKYSPNSLHKKLCEVSEQYDVDVMHVETNMGADFLKEVLPKQIPTKYTHSHKSKEARFLPVKMLYEQNKVSHNLGLDKLENQMATWSPLDKSSSSPDRVDALCFAFAGLMKSRRAAKVF